MTKNVGKQCKTKQNVTVKIVRAKMYDYKT